MALLSCYKNAISLEVYLDADGKALGNIYVDDGESFDYLTKEDASALIQFSYEKGVLKTTLLSGFKYAFPEQQTVTKITIFGLKSFRLLEVS